ncbi:unnamed protein product [Polarella glacialis]|uniref:Secreted protein n=1 Tax=Polarella glacialis TaxID=89957 RepID=A0A813HRU7_POLGL|nr:unnamed protein product [Polarella glacialis]CAE8651718.1 unnamed protein product [Polarella glacialis]
MRRPGAAALSAKLVVPAGFVVMAAMAAEDMVVAPAAEVEAVVVEALVQMRPEPISIWGVHGPCPPPQLFHQPLSGDFWPSELGHATVLPASGGLAPEVVHTMVPEVPASTSALNAQLLPAAGLH